MTTTGTGAFNAAGGRATGLKTVCDSCGVSPLGGVASAGAGAGAGVAATSTSFGEARGDFGPPRGRAEGGVSASSPPCWFAAAMRSSMLPPPSPIRRRFFGGSELAGATGEDGGGGGGGARVFVFVVFVVVVVAVGAAPRFVAVGAFVFAGVVARARSRSRSRARFFAGAVVSFAVVVVVVLAVAAVATGRPPPSRWWSLKHLSASRRVENVPSATVARDSLSYARTCHRVCELDVTLLRMYDDGIDVGMARLGAARRGAVWEARARGGSALATRKARARA